MEELKPLICPRCGGTITRSKMKCEYCGTEFEDNRRHGRTFTISTPWTVTSASLQFDYWGASTTAFAVTSAIVDADDLILGGIAYGN